MNKKNDLEYEEKIKIASILSAWMGKCPHKWESTGEHHYGNDYSSFQSKCKYCNEMTWTLETDHSPEDAMYLFLERGFFDLFTWAKEQDWFPDFVAFCNSVYKYSLNRMIRYMNDGGGFAIGDYGTFPIELVNTIEFPKMLYLFKIHYLHNQKRSLNAKRDIDEED